MRTLIVEDDALFIKIVSALLLRKTGPVNATLDSIDGLESLRARRYDVLITDLMMEGLNGADLIRIALCEGLISPEHILVITGERDSPLLSWIKRQGVRILLKPFTPEEFRVAFEAVRPAVPNH